ncbi:DUF6141 family protein [Guptibacillus spartinae]|uniref:DUF6141 family protein n=1 Tax=Guptibacillus spartinae TaxID=3025679 RepID=UPI00235DECC1|nr:DUF6141 family protein [Pseudalkalibacillus spartinae]
MNKQEKIHYKEVQRPNQVWIWAIVIGIAILMWIGFFRQVVMGIPFGRNPGTDMEVIILWIIFGIAFPIVMLGWLRLITEVRDDGVYVRFVPFHLTPRVFLYKDITHYESLNYRPLRRFGGWGIRWNSSGEKAYSISGKHGVLIEVNGEKVLIGSRKPERLVDAIDQMSGNRND